MKPLAGRTVLVTRPADQSVELVRRLRALGATALVAPTIEIGPIRSATLTRALRELSAGGFAWITLTSRATVDVLASRLNDPGDVRANVAAITGLCFLGTGPRFAPGAGGSPTSCQRRSRPPVWRARSLVAKDACCVRAPTSPHRVWRMRSPRRGGRPNASMPTARRWHDRPAEHARAARRRGRRHHVHERVHGPRFRRRDGRGPGQPEGGRDRAGHRGRGAHAWAPRVSGGTPAHDRGTPQRARAGPGRGVGRIARMSFPTAAAPDAPYAGAPCADPRPIWSPATDRAAVRQGGHRRRRPHRVDAGQFQHTLESLRKEAVDIASRGVTAFMVFAVPEHKDADGSEARTRMASRNARSRCCTTNSVTSTW